jgi:hypothetical protein
MCGDIDWSGVSGIWGKKGPDGAWYVIQFDNLFDAMGERDLKESGLGQYECRVKRIDLAEVPAKELKSAIESCGWEDMEAQVGELARVECCIHYGIGAPLWSDIRDNYPTRLRADARRAAEEFIRDSGALDAALDRPVNALGSTARDFGKGDIDAGLRRHIAGPTFGLEQKDLVAKMYGIEPHCVQFGTLQPDGTLTDQRSIPQNAMLACPHAIMDPSHYRSDNSCKCDDPAERERMIREWEYSEEDFKGVPLRNVG